MMKTILLLLLLFSISSKYCFPQWYQQNSGITGNISKVSFSSYERGFALSNDLLLATSDAGVTWEYDSYPFDTHFYDIYFYKNNGWLLSSHIFQGSFYRQVSHSSNGGINWYNVFGQRIDYWPWYSIHFINEHKGWVVGTVGSVCTTNDSGYTWSYQASNTLCYLNSVFFVDSLYGWAVGDYNPFTETNIIRTTDGGVNWIPVPEITPHSLRSVSFIDINHGWVVGDYGMIFKTSDAGLNWQFQECGVDTNYLNHFWEMYFFNSMNGWIVGKRGIILSTTDGGETWNKQESGTMNDLNSVFFIDSITGWICGNDGLILHTTNGGISFIEEDDQPPAVYFLLQNYPNPFNAETRIGYSVPEFSRVELKIIDVLGTELSTLVDEEKFPGKYELSFNAANLPSGTYFYRLCAGSYFKTKKMLLLK